MIDSNREWVAQKYQRLKYFLSDTKPDATDHPQWETRPSLAKAEWLNLSPRASEHTPFLDGQFNGILRDIDRAGGYPYTAIDMLEANGQLILMIRNSFLGFYYYFTVGLSVRA